MWHQIDLSQAVFSCKIDGFRVVESQEYSTTLTLVDTQQEHDVLERLLDESSKPAKPVDCSIDDYLLFTPFRYPPLREGTRFGKITERSPFYGSKDLEAAFAEKAHRRFQFNQDTEAKIPPFSIQYTSFKFHADADRALDLLVPPFDAHYAAIHDEAHYEESQALGTEMRASDVEACTFHSVRCKDAVNIAIFTPSIFKQKSTDHSHWQCHVSNDNVSFIQNRKIHYRFDK